MEMKTGQLYAPRYSGRKLTIYRVKHIAGKEIIMEFWEFDKKTKEIKLTDKYVPMDHNFFQTKRESEGIVHIDRNFREELNLPDIPEE